MGQGASTIEQKAKTILGSRPAPLSELRTQFAARIRRQPDSGGSGADSRTRRLHEFGGATPRHRHSAVANLTATPNPNPMAPRNSVRSARGPAGHANSAAARARRKLPRTLHRCYLTRVRTQWARGAPV